MEELVLEESERLVKTLFDSDETENKLEEEIEITEEILELGKKEEFWESEFWEKLEEDLEDWIDKLSFSKPFGVGKFGGLGPSGSKSAKTREEKLKINKKAKTDKQKRILTVLKDWENKTELINFGDFIWFDINIWIVNFVYIVC